MSTASARNPFSTCCVRPGRLAYQFAGAMTAPQLVERLASHGWWGQIVGPHGVGKSTLLCAMTPELVAAGRTVSLWTLHAGQRRWPAGMAVDAQAWHAATLVVVDGYEQLNRLARWRLKSRCRKTRAGLLIATHRAAGLPTLTTLDCPLATVQSLVAQLLAADPCAVTPDEVSSCYATHRGNVREVFFALYDLYENRRRPPQ